MNHVNHVLTILDRCKKCWLMPKDDFMWFPLRKRESVRTHVVLVVNMKRAQAKSPCDDEDTFCMVHQAEYPPQGNCKSVMEVLIMANNVHEEDACSHKVEVHCRGFDRLR